MCYSNHNTCFPPLLIETTLCVPQLEHCNDNAGAFIRALSILFSVPSFHWGTVIECRKILSLIFGRHFKDLSQRRASWTHFTALFCLFYSQFHQWQQTRDKTLTKKKWQHAGSVYTNAHWIYSPMHLLQQQTECAPFFCRAANTGNPATWVQHKKKKLKQDQNSRFDEHIFLLHTVSNYCLLLLPGNQANILLIPGVLIHNLEESPTRYKCV